MYTFTRPPRYRASHVWKDRLKAAGLTQAQWQKIRLQVIERDNHCCVECKRQGRITKGRDVDHIVPVAAGGSFTDLSNLQFLCKECHITKTQQDRREMGLVPVGCSEDGEPNRVVIAKRHRI